MTSKSRMSVKKAERGDADVASARTQTNELNFIIRSEDGASLCLAFARVSVCCVYTRPKLGKLTGNGRTTLGGEYHQPHQIDVNWYVCSISLSKRSGGVLHAHLRLQLHRFTFRLYAPRSICWQIKIIHEHSIAYNCEKFMQTADNMRLLGECTQNNRLEYFYIYTVFVPFWINIGIMLYNIAIHKNFLLIYNI